MPKVGEMVKVWIPGETPWAECVQIYHDGTFDGRIANRLFGQMSELERIKLTRGWFKNSPAKDDMPRLHGYRQDQVVRFALVTDDCGDRWVPQELVGCPMTDRPSSKAGETQALEMQAQIIGKLERLRSEQGAVGRMICALLVRLLKKHISDKDFEELSGILRDLPKP